MLTSLEAVAVTDGRDGTLDASFQGLGTWHYDYSTESWVQLSPFTASVLKAGNAFDFSVSSNPIPVLYGSFPGLGTFRLGGTSGFGNWIQLSPVSADAMAIGATGDQLFASFNGGGTWEWNAGVGFWWQIAAYSTTVMAFDNFRGGSLLFASYAGLGTWQFDGSNWTQISKATASVLASGVDYAGYFSPFGSGYSPVGAVTGSYDGLGTYEYILGGFGYRGEFPGFIALGGPPATLLHYDVYTDNMGRPVSDLYAATSTGFWVHTYTDYMWHQLTTVAPSLIAD
jgi:hypothetical protein